ncbi:hypothetical protein AB0K12_39625 [Nonomuraea sp. NPDC049419]|uniref:hypothetical protein n=1 Tax=Nonomuraea sp. NPDC049419 TaxID=3155772 RepID=UPI003416B7E7
MIAETTQPIVGLRYQVLDAADGGWPVVGDDRAQERGEAPPLMSGERAGEPGVSGGDGVAHAVQGAAARFGQRQYVLPT